MCLPEAAWCDGLEQCTDDELDCEVEQQKSTLALAQDTTTIGKIRILIGL